MSTGVASLPSHPPHPKKPSLAPKPKGLAVTSPRNTLIEGDSIESITSTSSSDTITNDTSAVPSDIQASTPEASKPNGNPSRPTPKPRKTINYKANGAPEVAPSPRPRVPPKRNVPSQESDQTPPGEESSSSSLSSSLSSSSSSSSSSSTLPNGSGCNIVTNGSVPSPRERPNVPVRRLTLGSSDLTPKVSPRTSPKWSPVRAPVQRSNSSTSDYSASSGTFTDGESDTPRSSVSSDTIDDDKSITSAVSQNKAENKHANTTVPANKPKPNISPKKPSLAMLSKRKTHAFGVSLDNDIEKSFSENGKKAVPQRPSLPPKRLSGIPILQGSSPKPTVKAKPLTRQSPEVSKEDPPQVNSNKPEELSDVVPCSGDPTNNNSSMTKDITEKHSTLKTPDSEQTSTASSGAKIDQPVEDPKAPPILPRKTMLRNPVAPPRRVKSMSESDPDCELNTDMKRIGNINDETSCQQKTPESHTKLGSGEEEGNDGKKGDKSDNGITERSTLKRNRRAVKSCDQLAFDSMKSPKDKRKGSNGEIQEKSKPPRPPPPSKPSGLIHQASLQGPPPRPKPIRAKTTDMTSPTRDKVMTESSRTSNKNSPKSRKFNRLTCGSGGTGEVRPSENETPDSSDWEIIDLTPQQKQQIDESGREKTVANESGETVANQKPKSDGEIVTEPRNSLPSSKASAEQSENVESKSEESSVTKESVIETAKQPEGDAVTQLKLRKTRAPVPAPVPAKRNSIEGSPVHKPSTTSVLEERDAISSDRNSQEINGRPLSQGSPVNGRSPNSSPKKMQKDKGRGSSPRRPSCPPPPPPGVPQAGGATPRSQSPSSKMAPAQPNSPGPSEVFLALKPKRLAPPRPNAPPVKTSSNSRSNSPKPTPHQTEGVEDQTNIYTEANAHLKNGEDGEESDESSRDHDYELIPDPRRTLTRNTDPPSSNEGETRKDNSNRASGYIDDGLYLEPNQREEGEGHFDNDYVYPDFVPANNIPVSPPTPPPNRELDTVFTSEPPPVEPSKNRRSSVPRRKAPQKPKRSLSVQSDASFESHGYYDMSGGIEGIERAHRSPSDRSGSLTDSSGNEDASLSDEDYDEDGSYAGVADQDSDDGFELPDARKRLQSLGRKAQKAFMVAKEIKDSEKVFVDVLQLLNVDLRQVIDEGGKKNGGKPVIDKATLDQIIGHLPHLQIFNECLLTDLETRIKNWSVTPKIADIFLTKGHFLKLYSQYILDFERITAAFDEACNKNPVFTQIVKEFEMSERCRSLAIKHYMLKPVQRIPQYKLLLTDYLKQLDANSEEYEKTTDALAIVSEVANHANESMRQGDNFEKLLAIQHSLIGSQEIVKPGRRFIKEGELLKMSRRVNQPRKFFLLSDILLHTTPFPPGQFKLNNELSLAGMKVNRSSQEESNELEIISVQRSFTLLASSKEDCDSWYNALTKTIDEYENKKSTFETLIKPEHKVLCEGDTSSLGRKAPLWIPDSRVTMCMICTSEFTITWRRHHCRACGKVTCGHCSKNKAPLMYLSDKEARVCDKCYETLVVSQQKEGHDGKEGKERTKNKSNKTKRRKSNRQPVRPSALKVSAKDQSNSSMSGYLWLRIRKKDWKRMWYRIKDKVLYTYKASEDVVALSSTPLLGYAVCVINQQFEGFEPGLILQLTQGRMKHILRSETPEACARWNEAMVEASCLD